MDIENELPVNTYVEIYEIQNEIVSQISMDGHLVSSEIIFDKHEGRSLKFKMKRAYMNYFEYILRICKEKKMYFKVESEHDLVTIVLYKL